MAEHDHGGHRARVRQRYIANGIDAFAAHELVELLLFYGIPRRDTNPLAHRLINTFGSVSGVINAEYEMLMEVEGMTENAAVLLRLVRDLKRYCAMEERPLGMTMHKTEDYVKYLLPRFEDLSAEEVWMLSLDILYRVIGVHQIGNGTPMMAEVSARDVVRFALADNAARVVIAHNHPSGIAIPSQADLDMTAGIARTLDTMGIKLIDHLIFASDTDCVSFRETPSIAPTLQGVSYE